MMDEDKELLKFSVTELIDRADKTRRKFLGDKFELCSIVNAKSGLCGEDCKFCAQSSAHSASRPTYPLKDVNSIVKEAGRAKEFGAHKFGIVTSGNRLTEREIGEIAKAISIIRETLEITVCASLGALKKEELHKLKNAGLSRYHHNIETSERFYSQVVSTHKFSERINTIRAAKESGLEVCSGGIIGMGETWQDRIDMARLLKELNVDSVPINILVPIKGTPLGSVKPISAGEAIKTLAIFRIILKDKIINIAAGRETVLKDFQGLGFAAGANGMLIGGYLTIKGRSVSSDRELIEEIKNLWKE